MLQVRTSKFSVIPKAEFTAVVALCENTQYFGYMENFLLRGSLP